MDILGFSTQTNRLEASRSMSRAQVSAADAPAATAPIEDQISVDPFVAGAALHAKTLANGGYAMAYRLKLGDWTMTGFLPAGASKEEMAKVVDDVMRMARQLQERHGVSDNDEIEFRFADPASVEIEQSAISVTAQSIAQAALPDPLLNMLKDFVGKRDAAQASLLQGQLDLKL
jgi:hypothetical protein